MPILVRKTAVAAQEVVEYHPEPEYVGFTAKAQRSKTRKGKNYFVIRITVPKYAAEQIAAGPEDHLVLKAKKALWYHMVDWNEMKPAWAMLPIEVRADVIMAGLPNPEGKAILSLTSPQATWTGLGSATSSSQPTLQLVTPTIPYVTQGVQ